MFTLAEARAMLVEAAPVVADIQAIRAELAHRLHDLAGW